MTRGPYGVSMFEELEAEAKLREAIEVHLNASQVVLTDLCEAHAAIGVALGTSLDGQDVWTAFWELSGRCLSLSNAYLHLLRHGFAPEAQVIARAIHEAAGMLYACVGPAQCDEEPMWSRWLADETWVSEGKVRKAVDRMEDEIHKELVSKGIEPLGKSKELADKIYDLLSKAGHNRRSGFRESVSRSLPRTFAYGPHPSVPVVAGAVAYATTLMETVVYTVGRILDRACSDDYFETKIRPRVDQMRTLSDQHPLTLDAYL